MALATAEGGSFLRASEVGCLQPLPGASSPNSLRETFHFHIATNQSCRQESALIKFD